MFAHLMLIVFASLLAVPPELQAEKNNHPDPDDDWEYVGFDYGYYNTVVGADCFYMFYRNKKTGTLREEDDGDGCVS